MRLNTLDSTRIRDYLTIKNLRETTLARTDNGKFIYLVNGEWISEEAFNLKYPLKLRPLTKSLENPCNKFKHLL